MSDSLTIRLRNDAERAAQDVLKCGRVYIAVGSELPHRLRDPHNLAWTGWNVDVVLQPWLHRWVGRAPCLVINDAMVRREVQKMLLWRPAANPDREFASYFHEAVVHELAHVATSSYSFEERSPAFVESVEKDLVASCAAPHQPPLSEPVPWRDHDAVFLRAAGHIAHRLAQRLGLLCSPHVETHSYGLSSWWRYAATISDEVVRLADVALADLARIAPPPAFRSLWTSDLRTWFLSLESPTAEQTRAFTTGVNLFDLP